MRRHLRIRPNIFLVVLTVLVGLLWAGTIGATMKWTAALFGLALAALAATHHRVEHRRAARRHF